MEGYYIIKSIKDVNTGLPKDLDRTGRIVKQDFEPYKSYVDNLYLSDTTQMIGHSLWLYNIYKDGVDLRGKCTITSKVKDIEYEGKVVIVTTNNSIYEFEEVEFDEEVLS